jgi:hypothetical protein
MVVVALSVVVVVVLLVVGHPLGRWAMKILLPHRMRVEGQMVASNWMAAVAVARALVQA